LGIPLGNVAILLLGLGCWRARLPAGLTGLSLALASTGLLGYVGLIVLTAAGGHGVAAAERVADYAVFVWMAGIGVWLVASGDPGPAEDGALPR
jgi:hypothetical protein